MTHPDRKRFLQFGAAGGLSTGLILGTSQALTAQTANERTIHRVEDLSAFPVNG
jgi:hypothetical protein